MVYVVLQRIILVQRIEGICGSTKNHTGANGGSSVYVALQRIILVQIEPPGFRLFYNE
jgi:hypothetical protein